VLQVFASVSILLSFSGCAGTGPGLQGSVNLMEELEQGGTQLPIYLTEGDASGNVSGNLMEKGNGITGDAAGEKGSAAVADFGIRLLTHCMKEEEGQNVLVSPLSVMTALTMTANGARGETLKQMEDVFGMPVPELNTYLSNAMQTLPNGDLYQLHLANAIWFKDEEGFTVEQDFLRTNEAYFKTGLYKAPFDHTTLQDINGWVKNHTDGMIENILDQIPADAVMYLVNALAFDAEWQKIYKEDQVKGGVFTKEDGTQQQARMMYSEETTYLETDMAEGFLKYYADKKYAFAALLPKEGVTVYECLSSLNGETWNSILSNPPTVTVHAAIPKYKTEYNSRMNEILQKMGITDAFSSHNADFSGIGFSEAGNLYLNQVLHKTFLAVDEKGTKAGAATVVEMMRESCMMAPEEIKTVYLDRPFLYWIIDCETNLPVFMGTVMEING